MTRYPIAPVPAPRVNGKSRFNPDKQAMIARYHAFRDECRLRKIVLPRRPLVIFDIAMPDSWSQKKRARMLGRDHEQRPDRDNLEKALQDAVLGEDCKVAWMLAGKRWAEEGAILIGSMDSRFDLRAMTPWIFAGEESA